VFQFNAGEDRREAGVVAYAERYISKVYLEVDFGLWSLAFGLGSSVTHRSVNPKTKDQKPKA
jgi:hypothetical protein